MELKVDGHSPCTQGTGVLSGNDLHSMGESIHGASSYSDLLVSGRGGCFCCCPASHGLRAPLPASLSQDQGAAEMQASLQTPTKTVGFRLQIRNPVGNFLLNFYWSMFALLHCGILCSPQSESPYLCKRMKLEQSLNTICKNKLQMD